MRKSRQCFYLCSDIVICSSFPTLWIKMTSWTVLWKTTSLVMKSINYYSLPGLNQLYFFFSNFTYPKCYFYLLWKWTVMFQDINKFPYTCHDENALLWLAYDTTLLYFLHVAVKQMVRNKIMDEKQHRFISVWK